MPPLCHYAIPPLIYDDLGMCTHKHSPYSRQTHQWKSMTRRPGEDDPRDEVKLTKLALFYFLSHHSLRMAISGCTTAHSYRHDLGIRCTSIYFTRGNTISIKVSRRTPRAQLNNMIHLRLYITPHNYMHFQSVAYSSCYSPNHYTHYLSITSSISLANHPAALPH